MSSNFLQRFKGKTQQISKDGVNEILGSKKGDAAYNPNQSSKSRQYNSVNNQKNSTHSHQINPVQDKKVTHSKLPLNNTNAIKKNAQNPFLVSNPFYLDEEERQREEIQKKERLRLEEEIRKAQKAEKDKEKQTTKTSTISRSLEKKKAKEWVKLGGLGPNIGGEQWMERKKKQDKMQEFSGLVKNINSEKIKPPRPDYKKQQAKEPNSRQKALDYSKNIPRPTIKKPSPEKEQIEYGTPKDPKYQELTQLQLYQMKHEQLKKMLNNQY